MVVARVFDGTDPEALQEHLRIIAPGLRLRPVGGEGAFHTRSLIVETGELMAWRNSYSRALQISVPNPPDNLVLAIPSTGGLQVSGPETHVATAGRLVSFLARETESLDIKADTYSDNLSIPVPIVNSRLAQLLDRHPREAVRFHPLVETQEGGPAAVRSVLGGFLHASDSHATTRSTAALRSLSTALIDLVLESLPHTHTEALHRPPPRIGPRQVRRAVAYIRDKPMPVLTIDELAVICGVSVRSLQYTFREFVGMTPAEYWRKIRLERAIEELRRSPSASLSSVAAAWGFTNATRFRRLANLS